MLRVIYTRTLSSFSPVCLLVLVLTRRTVLVPPGSIHLGVQGELMHGNVNKTFLPVGANFLLCYHCTIRIVLSQPVALRVQ